MPTNPFFYRPERVCTAQRILFQEECLLALQDMTLKSNRLTIKWAHMKALEENCIMFKNVGVTEIEREKE